MPRGVSRCPNCREPVSPFAAGCAICGTDLEQARAVHASRRRPEVPRPSLPAASRFGGVTLDWFNLGIALALAVFFSPIGVILCLYWASKRYHAGETVMCGLMLAIAAVGLTAIFAPFWFWSHFY